MGDANPIRTLGDYSKPSHEGYRNTIELPVGNNVVPFRSNTIRLVQNGCSFHGLRSEDPTQHLKDFLKLIDSLDLDGENSWNDPRDFAKPVKAISLPQDVPSTSDRHLIKLENQVQCLIEAHLSSTQPNQVNKITTSYEICSGPHDTQYCMKDPEQASVEYSSSRTDEVGGIVKDVEVHIGKLKLLNDFYVIDMKKDLETPLLVGRGFLATANAVIDYRMAKIAVGEGITRSVFVVKGVDLGEEDAPYWTTLGKRESYKPRPSSDGVGAQIPYYAFLDCHLPREWEIASDAKTNPFKDVLVFRRMVEFFGAIPINLKSNMWESIEL
ncbi:MAK10-like protein [Tanacetum coccineum]